MSRSKSNKTNATKSKQGLHLTHLAQSQTAAQVGMPNPSTPGHGIGDGKGKGKGKGKGAYGGKGGYGYGKGKGDGGGLSPGQGNTVTNSIPNSDDGAEEVAKCTASFDYDAVDTDELSLKEGEVYVILDRASVDWWRGHAVGAEQEVGLFPSSYIKEHVKITPGELVNPIQSRSGDGDFYSQTSL
jgi:hypothetical protein